MSISESAKWIHDHITISVGEGKNRRVILNPELDRQLEEEKKRDQKDRRDTFGDDIDDDD